MKNIIFLVASIFIPFPTHVFFFLYTNLKKPHKLMEGMVGQKSCLEGQKCFFREEKLAEVDKLPFLQFRVEKQQI
jgi:hypothetical protein